MRQRLSRTGCFEPRVRHRGRRGHGRDNARLGLRSELDRGRFRLRFCIRDRFRTCCRFGRRRRQWRRRFRFSLRFRLRVCLHPSGEVRRRARVRATGVAARRIGRVGERGRRGRCGHGQQRQLGFAQGHRPDDQSDRVAFRQLRRRAQRQHEGQHGMQRQRHVQRHRGARQVHGGAVSSATNSSIFFTPAASTCISTRRTGSASAAASTWTASV
mgnify:CR=1 FL=1